LKAARDGEVVRRAPLELVSVFEGVGAMEATDSLQLFLGDVPGVAADVVPCQGASPALD